MHIQVLGFGPCVKIEDDYLFIKVQNISNSN